MDAEEQRFRCFGSGDPLYSTYHDEEWGRPLHGDAAIFERIVLEGFQSGLSWLTILRKREAFRKAFAGFAPIAVAAFGGDDIDRLLADSSIVRNRRKIEAAVVNAQATVALHDQGLSLDNIVWSHRPAKGRRPQNFSDIHASTPEAVALTTELKHHGFRFIGPATAYATMQAIGVVNDHMAGCPAGDEIDQAEQNT